MLTLQLRAIMLAAHAIAYAEYAELLHDQIYQLNCEFQLNQLNA